MLQSYKVSYIANLLQNYVFTHTVANFKIRSASLKQANYLESGHNIYIHQSHVTSYVHAVAMLCYLYVAMSLDYQLF